MPSLRAGSTGTDLVVSVLHIERYCEFASLIVKNLTKRDIPYRECIYAEGEEKESSESRLAIFN